MATIRDKKIGVSLASDSSLIDHYEADVKTAQDYYPFGMIMPGRMFTAISIPGGTYSGTTTVNGYTLPVDLTVNSRTGTTPSTYTATHDIDFTEGFETGTNDNVTAYIADTSYAGGGNGDDDGSAIAGTGKYRYGFNGKENDNEIKGIGDQIDYGMRVYDPRVGKFMSLDPLQNQYPELTPYQYASNSPITFIDQDGLEMGYKMPDGTIWYPPPSDHNRVPVPTDAVQLPVNMGGRDHENPLTRLAESLLTPPIQAVNTLVSGRVDRYKPASIELSKDGQIHYTKARNWVEKARFRDYVDAGMTILTYASFMKGGGEGGGEGGPGEMYAEPGYKAGKLEPPSSGSTEAPTVTSQARANNGSSQASGGNPSNGTANAQAARGSNNPVVKNSLNIGNKVHYDQLNGGPPGSTELPTELQALYPNTQFRFAGRGAKGVDVEVVGGQHPSTYPNSTWGAGNNYGDFKPATTSGARTFRSDMSSGKIPQNTQRLDYDPATGKLK